ncbi:Glycosyltransferase family protein [Vigna angularis]|uniref:Glycosyltransferase family protein n=1 Tax=Phaseolus angularis TaxID=3914 RepID=A0A8T0KV99_PHAAN|nr:Glycosyltransferase family protein [Vigna angularis]
MKANRHHDQRNSAQALRTQSNSSSSSIFFSIKPFETSSLGNFHKIWDKTQTYKIASPPTLCQPQQLFLPRPDHISTSAVLICDDDVEVDSSRWNSRSAGIARAQGIVDAVRNFEDVLMNLVVAEEAHVAPLLVGAKRVRDYGDARNEGEEGVRVGLSSRKGEHRKRRGLMVHEEDDGGSAHLGCSG